MTIPQCGEKADITIKGVRIVNHPSARLVRIADEHGDTYDMPPQAAITRPGEGADDGRITAVLAYLDGAEMEGYIQPYVASTVRKTLGLPPRHWPPQAGDVWHDGLPDGFFAPLWFAQAIRHEEPGPFQLVMVPMECGTGAFGGKTPEALLAASDELRLVYRHKDGA